MRGEVLVKYRPDYLLASLLSTLFVALTLPCAANAGKLSLVVNGKSFHSSSTYEVKHTNIIYTCANSTPQKLDLANIPSDCQETSRDISTFEKKYNENNNGYGLIYEFGNSRKSNSGYIPYVSVGAFRDSFETNAKYISGGLNKRISLSRKLDNLHMEFGGVISVIDSPSYADGDPMVTFMPVLSLGTNSFGVNLTYLPKVNSETTNVFFLQLETTLSK